MGWSDLIREEQFLLELPGADPADADAPRIELLNRLPNNCRYIARYCASGT